MSSGSPRARETACCWLAKKNPRNVHAAEMNTASRTRWKNLPPTIPTLPIVGTDVGKGKRTSWCKCSAIERDAPAGVSFRDVFLARALVRRVERYPRDRASLDAGRRQDPDDAHAAGEPL